LTHDEKAQAQNRIKLEQTANCAASYDILHTYANQTEKLPSSDND